MKTIFNYKTTLKVKFAGRVFAAFMGFIKSTDHRPANHQSTDHRPLTYRLTNQPTQ